MLAGKVGHECISGKFVVCYCATASVIVKSTWCLTSTETIRLIRDGSVIVTVLRKTSIGNVPNFAGRRNGYSF